jgi:fibronectin-binding autotransporter adhesin
MKAIISPGLFAAVVYCGAVLWGGQGAFAATYTWNSAATGTNWNAASNWGGAVPGSGDIGLFAAASYNAQPATITTTASIGGIWDTGSAPLTVSGMYNLALFGTTINSNSGTGIELDAGAGQLTVNTNLALILQNSQQWIDNSTNSITVNGIITGNSLTYLGIGALILSGDNAFNSNNLTIAGGTLQLTSGTAFGGITSAFDEYVGNGGTAAVVVQTGGSNVVSASTSLNGLLVGYAGQGSYTLSGGSLSANNEYVSYSGLASFTQTGGTNSVGYLSVGTYYNGTYNLSGSGLLKATTEYVGDSGNIGTFNQNGGTNAVSGNLVVGNNSSFGGAYNLNAGSLSAANEYVGQSVAGTFNHAGGTNTVSGALYIAVNGSGTYSLSGNSQLIAPTEYIGDSAAGSFSHSSGTNSVTSAMYLGYNGGSSGGYSLSGNGVLLATTSAANGLEYVGYSGTGTFTQSGGTNTVNTLKIAGLVGASGTYSLTGASLLTAGNVYLGFGGAGVFAQSGGTATITTDMNVSEGTASTGAYSLSGGGLLAVGSYLAVGYNGTGSFTLSNATNSVGGLNLGSNGISSRGTYNLNGGGVLTATTEYVGNPGSGVFMQSGGTNSIGSALYVDNSALSGTANYSLGNGLLAAPTEYIGYSGSGSFAQSGGTNAVSGNLLIGFSSAASKGSYNLGGSGSLSANVEYVGTLGIGNFTQTGGTNSAGSLIVQGTASGGGTYNLSGNALLSTTNEDIGYSNNFFGGFTQSGGTNLTANFLLGGLVGSSGTFILSGGSLAAPGEVIGSSGSGSFTQTGGTNATSFVNLAYPSYGYGVYNLNGGLLLAGSGGIVAESANASFNLGGGTLSASAPWSSSINMTLTGSIGNSTIDTTGGSIALFGNLTGSATLSKVGPGILSLSGTNSNFGELIVNGGTVQVPGGAIATSTEYIGNSGNGSFTQAGGTHSIRSELYIGYGVGSSGAYSLSGNGVLSVTNSAVNTFEYIGYAGSGSFTQAGGTNFSSSYVWLGYYPGSSGAYSLSGGGLLSTGIEEIGVAGTGSFTQANAANSANYVYLAYSGSSSGTYNLNNGGSLSAAYEYVGNSGNGSFTQAGGTNSIGTLLMIAYTRGSSGAYTLSGGSLVSTSEVIGQAGSGSFTQSGGTNSPGTMYLAASLPYGFGVYNLNGGLLLAPSGGIFESSNAAFDFGGGTLGTTAPWSSAINVTLTGSGGNATIDTTGGNIGLSGVLSGSGGLNKQGTNALFLSGTNSFSGNTTISAGTLLLANANAAQNSTVNVLVDNGLQFLHGIGTFNLGGLSGGDLLTLSDTAGSAVTLSAGGNGANTTYSGNLGGNGAMVKVGTGLLTLTGANSFVGGTTISGGAIAFTTTAAVPGTGAITIGPSGALVATPIYSPAAPVQSWLAGGRIAANPTGAIALPNGASDNESIALSATASGLSLGAIGSATYSGALTTAGSTIYLGGGGGALYFTSSLSGSGSLAVGTRGVPGGSVILTGVNALGGTLVVDGGSLQLPSGSLTMTSSAAGYEYVGYSGTGTFTQSGGTNTIGTALVLGQNPGAVGAYNLFGGLLVVTSIVQGSGSGSLNIAGGSLTAATGALTVSTPIVLTTTGSAGTFDTSSSSLTLAGQISGAGGLTKTGSATLVLAANNTYTGATTVAQGALLLTNSNAAQNTSVNVAVDNGLQFGTGVGTFNIGALGGAGDLVLADTGGNAITAITGGNSATATYSGAISGGGTLVHGGSGVLVLNGVNSYTGGTILTADATPGGVVVTSQSSFAGPFTFAGDNRLGFAASMSATNSIAVNSGVTGSIDTMGNMVALSGLMSGGGTLNKTDTTGDGTLVLSASNPFSGTMSISQGTLQLANANAAANSTVAVNTDNGLQFSPGIGTFNVGGLSGGNALTLADTGGAPVNVVVGGNNQNTTYTGMIVGAGTLTKAGSGSLDLEGTNTWTGSLALDPGTVSFNSNAALGGLANRIIFLGSGTLQAQATIALSAGRTITVNSGATATFDPGGNVLTVAGSIGGSGAVTVTDSGTLVLANTNSYSGGTFVNGGALEVSTTASLPGAFTPGKVSVAGGAMLIAAVGGPQQWTAAEVNQLLAVSGLFGPGAAFGIDAGGGPFNVNSINYSGIVLAMTGSNSYSGVTAISQGTLELADSAALVNSTVEIDADNRLQFSPGIGTFSLGGLSGSHRLDLDNTSGGGVALVLGGNGASTTFSGEITGGGSLTKMGEGTLLLSGSDTYSGGTNVGGGTLIVTNNEGLTDGSSVSVGNASLFAAAVPAANIDKGGVLSGAAVAVPEPSALALLAAGSLIAASAAAGLKKPRAATV